MGLIRKPLSLSAFYDFSVGAGIDIDIDIGTTLTPSVHDSRKLQRIHKDCARDFYAPSLPTFSGRRFFRRCDDMRPSPQVIAMKLPMLFKSLFESEPTPAAPPPVVEREPEEAPPIEPEKAPRLTRLEQRETTVPYIARHSHDPLLDCIDTLGEIVLSLDAQLREERTSNTALRSSLNRELAALRNVLQ